MVVKLPGRVIADTICFSRALALQSPPKASGMFLQVDDGVEWSRDSNTVSTVLGMPLEDGRLYLVATELVNLRGTFEKLTPLLEYVASRPADAGNAAGTATVLGVAC